MQSIPLHELTYSDTYNVRKTDRDRNLDELVASIKAHGLLENLLVVRSDDQYEVIAGGRRLAALRQLQEEAVLPADFPVACELVSAEDAHELSLVENSVREAMHPADQFEAWAKLTDEGLSVADIAARFGIREELVRQRLKLGRVSPRLLQAYRDEQISLDVLMAYTLTDDHQRQEAVYDSLVTQRYSNHASSVRRALTEDAVSSRDCRAKFIGMEAYEAAGGSIRRDLFNEDCYFEDAELLNGLVRARLNEAAEEISDRWAWVDVRIEFPYDEQREFRRIFPHSLGCIPAELSDRYDELSERLDEISESEDDSEALTAEQSRIEQELEQVQEAMDAYHGFTEDERAISGCVVSLGYQAIELHEGLMRPEDRQKLKTLTAGEDVQATDTPSSPYSQSVVKGLRNYRLHPLRLALSGNFDAAFDAAAYALASRHFHHRSEPWLGVQLQPYYYPHRMHTEDAAINMLAREEEQFGTLPLSWLDEEDDAARFTAFCGLTRAEKQLLFSVCIASALRPQLATDKNASPIVEGLYERLQVDVADHWRPTAESFLSRVPKAELLAIGKTCISESWPAVHRKTKKGELVEMLHHAFNVSDGPG
jgi:ParB family chromosome partitioning protein